jgi:transporter family protein
MNWWALAGIAIIAWGAVGYLQKISASLLHPSALLFWVVIGLLLGSVTLLAWLPTTRPTLTGTVIALGIVAGLANAVGSWCLFRALDRGAPASLAVPLTALYPLVTIALALLFLHEVMSGRQVAGALLAILGGALLSYERPTPAQAL